MARDRFGIDDGYHDARGTAHVTTPETRAALLAAMGIGAEEVTDTESGPPPVRVVVAGAPPTDDDVSGDLILEDGTRRTVERGHPLPSDLPLGYHHLYPSTGGETLLVVAPPALSSPRRLQDLGVRRSALRRALAGELGIGDPNDLARLGAWTRRRAAAP